MKKRGKNKFGTAKSTGLIITSLIDFFSIVVIYLMKSYSAEGNLLTNADNLTLPNSYANKKVTEVYLQVTASNDVIMVDNKPAVTTDEVRRIPPTQANLVIPKLKAKLEEAMKKEEEQVKLGTLNKVMGNVTIQIDKNIEFDVLYKLMMTCADAGYNVMNFAVMEREGE